MKYIVKAFKEKNIDQKVLMKDLNVTQPYASLLMSGKKPIGKRTAEKLSQLYGFDKLLLLADDDLDVDTLPKNFYKLPSPQQEQRFYKALPKNENSTEEEVVDLNRWADPNHLPIPVFDNTYGVESISELLKNDSYKPTVILLKGHLGCHAVVRHIDSAMNKHFGARCQLGIERLKSFKKRIEPGKPYMIVLEELTLTRYVFEKDNQQFILRSADVELYPDMLVNKEEVIEMWRIRSLTPIPDQQLF